MERGSLQEFIFEHYFGYTKISETVSQEYKINHPRWQVNEIKEYHIDCNFKEMYGDAFAKLENMEPEKVFIAEGSDISVDWKRYNI